MIENIREFCSEVVTQSGNYPEVTVAAWVVSALLMLVQIYRTGSWLMTGKKEDVEELEVACEAEPIVIPYIPGEKVQKLVKLLNNQESGWKIDHLSTSGAIFYGSLKVYLSHRNTVSVSHNGVLVDLGHKDYRLDQVLISEAFQQRMSKERNKINVAALDAAKKSKEASNRAADAIFDTI